MLAQILIISIIAFNSPESVETEQEVFDAMIGQSGWNRAKLLIDEDQSGKRDIWLEFQWRWNLPLYGETLEESVEKTQTRLDELWQAKEAGQLLFKDYDFMILRWLGKSVTDEYDTVLLDTIDPDHNRIFEPIITIRNGNEVIEIDAVEFDGDSIKINFEHYDSYIEADFTWIDSRGDGVLEGSWTKDRGDKGVASMPFIARIPMMRAGYCPNNGIPIEQDVVVQLDGRWDVQFEESGNAVGEFEILSLNEMEYSRILSTFRTPTGDYRFIAGWVDPWDVYSELPKLQMSAFDGAHAFHFTATLQEDGSLKGDFYSGNWHHETWTAVRDDDAKLPDAFKQTTVTDEHALDELVFKDIDGKPVKVLDALDATGAKARVIEIFGSWCPNCADASRELVSLKKKYGDELGIVGLAFEVTEDFERSSQQVKRHHEHLGTDWELLIAGLADKEKATGTLGFLDQVRAFPTLVFLDAHNRVQAVYSGFSGPATGDAYTRQRARFEKLIEKMIKE